MRRAERVIVALAALGEARKAAAGPQGPDPVAAPGDDLVRIALVADVPHDLVARRVEHIMQRGGQLDEDRKSVVWGKSVSVRVDLGGSRIIKKKNKKILS